MDTWTPYSPGRSERGRLSMVVMLSSLEHYSSRSASMVVGLQPVLQLLSNFVLSLKSF